MMTFASARKTVSLWTIVLLIAALLAPVWPYGATYASAAEPDGEAAAPQVAAGVTDQVYSVTDAVYLVSALVLTTASGTEVTSPAFKVAGRIDQYAADGNLAVKVGETAAAIGADGSFTATVPLKEGLNSLTVQLLAGAAVLDSETLTVTYKPPAAGNGVEVEAAPEDITVNIEGPRKKIDYIDQDITGIDNIIALFTREFGSTITIPLYNVAVQVGADSRVMRVVNPAGSTGVPSWTGPTELEIPQGGYVLHAQDTSYANNDIKRFLATKFKVGDVIKLRKNGEVVPVSELMSGRVKLALDNYQMVTSTKAQELVSGNISNVADLSAIQLLINDTAVPVAADGSFSYSYPLQSGINYIQVKVMKNGVEDTSRDLVVFSRPGFTSGKGVILWVDQAANARKFQTSQHVYEFLKKAKDNGVTEVVFDVKGVEGYASYKKNDLTGRPYVSEITAPAKAGANPDLDLLEEFITHGHDLGLKIHAAINVFAEGSIASNEYAVLDDHTDWEERIYVPENNGQIKRLRESAKQGLVAFVNPSNDEVRQYELKTFEEVIKNYDVDGVVHDRGRYDNESADFSDLTRTKFEAFLQARGKQLHNWPADVFSYNGSIRVNGPLIQDWWEFRSGTIKSFFGEVKSLVDSYEASAGREIQVSSYVGSWYETYYLNGVNWGSPNFRFDSRLGLKDESVYTPGYYQTGYIEYLDFLMVGAYQTTGQEVEKYITLGNIVTNGEIPLYAGIALTNVQAPELQREVFQSGLANTNGLMLFDASQINWPIASAALKNQVYVKDYQVGFSLPGNPEHFLEGNFHNINLVEGNINAYTDSFGYSTGTSRFGVEVVVEADGTVSKVLNRNQAINWSWGSPEENNSVIPTGGFVISTLDPSGTKTKRQLVANAYKPGDEVRGALLSGYLPYEGMKTADSQVAVKGNVEVLGKGAANVQVAGKAAAVSSTGDFQATVPLTVGVNSVTMAVYVDGFKTNEKTVQITRTQSTGGSSGYGGGVAEPELVKQTAITGPDGRAAALFQVHEAQLAAKLKALIGTAGAASGKPELQIPATDSTGAAGKGAVTVSIPVGPFAAAVASLPGGGKVVVQTDLGQLALPMDVLSQWTQSAAAGKSVELTLRPVPEAEQTALAGKLQAKGASGLAEAIEISLGVKEGERLAPLTLPKGSKGMLSLPLASSADPGRLTVMRLNKEGGLSFVPAKIEAAASGSLTVHVRLDGTVTLAVAQVEPETYGDMTGHWAEKAVGFLSAKLVVDSMGDGGFLPESPLTRAQYSAMLVRALGLEASAAATGGIFTDVAADSWYAVSVNAAVYAGITEGYEDGSFRPDARITREEMAVMLYRALQAANAAPAADASAVAGLADGSELAGWSREAVGALLAGGLINGRTEGGFVPAADATRAEGAAVLQRLLGYLEANWF
ncbi:S-layer homology domain-containing protein [Paenibacillus sp. YN15]|uniref:S-layer homology domain-containing protein n=1 Tax=Paenibacillus sp. YN15 TaxID=1742774 RepID=UPI000DCCEA0B|nr:S-layer homology domain-containing protein [Paenibacillus sp. YN15]RAU96159.1 S-layer protein [Paenibacillus sp. YN15]